MRKYCGNAKPYLFCFSAPADEKEAEGILCGLCECGHALWHTSRMTAAEERRLKRAAALLLFLSPEAAAGGDVKRCVALANASGIPILCIHLRETALSPGLALQLGTIQGVLRQNCASDAALLEKIGASPVLQALSVTDAQKKAAKRSVAGLIAGIAAVAALAVLCIAFNPFQYFTRIDPDSELGKLGLSGSPMAITELYVYGSRTRETYSISQSIVGIGEAEITGMLITDDTGERFENGTLSDLTDFSQLKNLEELCLAGNSIRDVTPLFVLEKLRRLDLTGNQLNGADISGLAALPALETLDLAYTDISDASALLGSASLKTLYLSSDMGEAAASVADADFELRYVDCAANDLAQLEAALTDGSIHRVNMAGQIVIPAGETLTVRENVQLGGVNGTLVNYGTLVICGALETGMEDKQNHGTIIIRDGGILSGGMGSLSSDGTVTIEAGGVYYLERGEWFVLQGGVFENGGYIRIQDGGQFRLNGGTLINTGLIELYTANAADTGGGFYGDRDAVQGDGTFDICE